MKILLVTMLVLGLGMVTNSESADLKMIQLDEQEYNTLVEKLMIFRTEYVVAKDRLRPSYKKVFVGYHEQIAKIIVASKTPYEVLKSGKILRIAINDIVIFAVLKDKIVSGTIIEQNGILSGEGYRDLEEDFSFLLN